MFSGVPKDLEKRGDVVFLVWLEDDLCQIIRFDSFLKLMILSS